MKRREFLKQSLSASAVVVGAGYASLDMIRRDPEMRQVSFDDRAQEAANKVAAKNPTSDEGIATVQPEINPPVTSAPKVRTNSPPDIAFEQLQAERAMTPVPSTEEPVIEEVVLAEGQTQMNGPVKIAKPQASAENAQQKITNFETNFTDDVILSEADYKLLVASLERLNRVQDYVGFGNFNVLSFDEALAYGKHSPRIGKFTKEELEFMDMLFFYDSTRLGFFGDKVIDKQTNSIGKKDVVKMPGTGHYVFRGHSEDFYRKIRTEVGDTLILTSGVRNIVKQYQLFMAKTVQASGNLSRASRSLAPPGHSYHAIGDFDVGQVGAGLSNFTTAFSKTDEFKRLQDLGYVQIRYTPDNDLGVRYEPWHIRVV